MTGKDILSTCLTSPFVLMVVLYFSRSRSLFRPLLPLAICLSRRRLWPPTGGRRRPKCELLRLNVIQQKSDLLMYFVSVPDSCTFSIGDVSGEETQLSAIPDTEIDCASLVIAQHPSATGATYQPSSKTCFAKFGDYIDPNFNSYRSCLFASGNIAFNKYKKLPTFRLMLHVYIVYK